MSIINDLSELLIRIAMWIVFVRFWIQWAYADFYNPISQGIVKLSNPVCQPFRKLVPANRRYDWGSLIAFIALALLRWLLDYLLMGSVNRQLVDVDYIIRNTFYLLLDVSLMAIFFMLIIQAIASWIAGSHYNPAIKLISQLTEPLLRPIRRIFPPSGGLDFSPMIAMILVWLLLRIFTPSPGLF
ncbi:MAG TPA: YggT family protein [Aeromonadales bacterium]|nr:YggT family protein [Aeromonadales bacterium]